MEGMTGIDPASLAWKAGPRVHSLGAGADVASRAGWRMIFASTRSAT